MNIRLSDGSGVRFAYRKEARLELRPSGLSLPHELIRHDQWKLPRLNERIDLLTH